MAKKLYCHLVLGCGARDKEEHHRRCEGGYNRGRQSGVENAGHEQPREHIACDPGTDGESSFKAIVGKARACYPQVAGNIKDEAHKNKGAHCIVMGRPVGPWPAP